MEALTALAVMMDRLTVATVLALVTEPVAVVMEWAAQAPVTPQLQVT